LSCKGNRNTKYVEHFKIESLRLDHSSLLHAVRAEQPSSRDKEINAHRRDVVMVNIVVKARLP
jgi:hypothetical protein